MAVKYRAAPAETKSLIVRLEGEKSIGYPDSKGIPTAGIGHTGSDVRIGVKYSAAQIELWFERDVADAIATIYSYVPSNIIDGLPENSWLALISFVFNVGTQAFVDLDTGKPTNFRRTLLSGNLAMVSTRMKDWNKARIDGRLVSVPGLTIRRATEAALWSAGLATLNKPAPAPAAVPVAPALDVAPAVEAPAPLPEDTLPESSPVSDTQKVLPVPLPDDLGSQGGVVPAPPTKPPADKTRIFASASAGVGAFTSIAPEVFTDNGQQLLYLREYLPIFGTIGGILIVIGAGIMIYQAYKSHKERGA